MAVPELLSRYFRMPCHIAIGVFGNKGRISDPQRFGDLICLETEDIIQL